MSLGLIHDKSSLLQECHHPTTITSLYYLSQCWPRAMPPHCVTQQDELFSNAWPQSVNIFEAETKWSPLCRRHVEIHFLERDILLSIKISLTLVPRSDHFPTLVQVMALRWLGDKPSFETMMAWFGAALDLNRARDLNGLVSCYVMLLPWFRYQVRKRPPTNTDPVRKYLNNMTTQIPGQCRAWEKNIPLLMNWNSISPIPNPWRLLTMW